MRSSKISSSTRISPLQNLSSFYPPSSSNIHHIPPVLLSCVYIFLRIGLVLQNYSSSYIVSPGKSPSRCRNGGLMMSHSLRGSPNARMTPTLLAAQQRKRPYHQSAHWLTLVVRPIPAPEAFKWNGTLQDLNANPSMLIQNIPSLWESQQMYDLYTVVTYNGGQRPPIESIWQQWTEVVLP